MQSASENDIVTADITDATMVSLPADIAGSNLSNNELGVIFRFLATGVAIAGHFQGNPEADALLGRIGARVSNQHCQRTIDSLKARGIIQCETKSADEPGGPVVIKMHADFTKLED